MRISCRSLAVSKSTIARDLNISAGNADNGNSGHSSNGLHSAISGNSNSAISDVIMEFNISTGNAVSADGGTNAISDVVRGPFTNDVIHRGGRGFGKDDER